MGTNLGGALWLLLPFYKGSSQRRAGRLLNLAQGVH